jgi:hypothetical protein
VESNKDRQYRTDHDRCWYTVEVKLALLAHRPAARSGSHTSDNGKRSVFKTRSPYGLPVPRRGRMAGSWLWLGTPRLSRRSTRPSMRCPCTTAS